MTQTLPYNTESKFDRTKLKWIILTVFGIYAVLHEASAGWRWEEKKAQLIREEQEELERMERTSRFAGIRDYSHESITERMRHFETNLHLKDNPYAWFR